MQVNLIPDERDRYDNFISHFNIIKDSKLELQCNCPSCNKDKLYISCAESRSNPGTHTMLLDCKHGCKCKDIISAAGLEPKDLYLTQLRRSQSWKSCADIRSHIYNNADGTIFARKDVYKFHSVCIGKKSYYPGDKQALWYLYDHNSKKFNDRAGLHHQKAPLYHLDHITEAKVVFIPEGEKDVETLEKLGFAATTNGGGASEKWENVGYAKYLKNTEMVYILCDNDEPGKVHGVHVGNYLKTNGIPCKVIQATDIYSDCKPKWDITDICVELGAEKTIQLLNAAVNSSEDYTPQPEVQAIEDKKSDPGQLTQLVLEKFLADHFISLKTNVITHKMAVISEIELKEYHAHNIPEILPVWLYDRLYHYKKASVESIQRMITAIAMKEENECNPPLELIDAQTWDGKSRFEDLCKLLTIADDDKLSRALIRKWLMQTYCVLHNTIKDPFSADGVLVLIGTQGFGKTRLLEKLALGSNNFGEGRCYDPHNKDSNIQVTSKWITELGEIGSTMRKDTDLLKAFISSSTDEFRAPYGRTAITYPRRTSFCGSTNDTQFLIDETGNRRFWTITLDNNKHIDINGADFKNFDVLQLWAEIKAMVDTELAAGKSYSTCFRLTHTELEELAVRNRDHSKLLKGEQEVIDILSKYDDSTLKYYTISEFKRSHEELRAYSAQQIGKVLHNLGYDQKTIKQNGKNVRKYHLPLHCVICNAEKEQYGSQ